MISSNNDSSNIFYKFYEVWVKLSIESQTSYEYILSLNLSNVYVTETFWSKITYSDCFEIFYSKVFSDFVSYSVHFISYYVFNLW
jgi:hypothetical protein